MAEPTHYEMMVRQLKRRKPMAAVIDSIGKDHPDQVWKVIPMVLGHAIDESGNLLHLPDNLGPDGFAASLAELVRWVADQQSDKFSYSECMTNANYMGCLEYLAKAVSPGEAVTTVQLNYHMVSHERGGKRVYSVSPGLAEKLRYTEIRGIRTDDLRLPYEAIYIQIPPEAKLKVWNSDTGWHRAVGAYLVEEHRMTEDDVYHVGREAGSLRGWRMLLVGHDRAEMGPGDDALAFFRVLLKEGESLEWVIQKARDEMTRAANHDPFSTWDDKMALDWEQQFRWCMNVVLYATWQEPGTHWIANKEARQLWERIQKCPKGKKKAALSRRFQGLDPQRRIKLGATIVIDRKKSGIGGEESGNSRHDSRKLTCIKTRVSGHWRNVAHGPKHSLRRYQWIEPFWRNKDGVELEGPQHELR
jgi:hypothetical protein